MEALSTISFLLSGVVLVFIVIALIKPHSKVFTKLFRKPVGRKKIYKVLGPIYLALFVVFVVFAPPTATGINKINLENKQDVLNEKYTIEGKVEGSPRQVRINDEELELKGSEFKKEVSLKPGDNEFTITTLKEGVAGSEDTYMIYYDYEGSIYEELAKKDKQAAEELANQLNTIPVYEVVRKENIPDGIAVIIYMEGNAEEYLVTNLVKNFRFYNQDKKVISALVIQKSDKVAAEGILESTDPTGLTNLIKANYEKRPDREQLFYFPTGLKGNKLALEIK